VISHPQSGLGHLYTSPCFRAIVSISSSVDTSLLY
jgi:hypothetical protein